MLVKELRPRGWTAFFQYALPVMVACIILVVGHKDTEGSAIFSGVVLVACLAWMGLLTRCKAVLTSQRLEYSNGFSTRSVDKRDIAGYRVVEGRNSSKVAFEIKGASAKTITFPLWIKEHPDAVAWFTDLTDLDAADTMEAEAALECDAAFGPDPESRRARAKFLAQLVAGLWFASILLLFANSFGFEPFWTNLAMVALPLIALGLEVYFSGQLRIAGGRGKTDPRPSLLGALVFPIFMLALTAALSLHLLNLQSALLWAVPVAALLTVYIASRAAELRGSPWVLAVAVGSYAYAFGALAHCDVLFDHGARQVYPVTIVDLHENHGKHTSYHVGVGPWPHDPNPSDFSVSHDFYANRSMGETLCIAVGRGAFGWAWYDLETCPE